MDYLKERLDAFKVDQVQDYLPQLMMATIAPVIVLVRN